MIKEFIKKIFGGKPVIELSYSRFQAYKRCPWLFKLVYIDSQRSSPNGSMSLGISLHRALAAYLSPENPQRSLDRLWQIYDEVWVNEGFIGTQETLDSYDSGRKMLEKFFESDQRRKSAVVSTEKEFTVPLDGIKLMGTIDRIDQNPDGSYEIIEYKTQSEHWNTQRVGTDLQLTLYAYGAEKGLGYTPIKMKYSFLCDGTELATERSTEQQQAALNLVFETAEKIRAGHFEPNHAYCDRCEFAKRCVNYLGTGSQKFGTEREIK